MLSMAEEAEAASKSRLPLGPEAMAHLKSKGYVVIAGALNPEEVTTAMNLMWEFLEQTDLPEEVRSGIKRGDPGTWGDATWPGNPANGIITAAGAGQSDFQWFVRMRPTVMAAFAAIWEVSVEDLITSFDVFNVFRPWQGPSGENIPPPSL